MKQYKAIVSDIDGTLIAEEPLAIPSQRVKDSIAKAMGQGIHFVLATGRPLSMLEYLFKEIQFTDLVIMDNGAMIYDAGKKKAAWETIMNNRDLIETLVIASEYKREIAISTADRGLIMPKAADLKTRARKFSLMGMTLKEANDFAKKIEAKYKNLSVSLASDYKGKDWYSVYVLNADATKQHAILKVAELLGISTDEIIGVGDHYNDFPLLMACGLKVAMGNAVSELKEIADYIAPSVKEDGIVDVIEKFILNHD